MPFIVLFRRLVLLLLAFSFARPSSATSVKSLDLPDIVRQAEVIADVTVTNIQPYWSSPGGAKAIHTRVTFQLNRATLKGEVSSPFYLDFLGGVIGGRAMKVSGMPEPAVGDRLLIFSYAPGKVFVSPIVGFDQGALRVVRGREDGIDRVYRWWGQPVNQSQPFDARLLSPFVTGTPEQLSTANSVDEFWRRVSIMSHQ
jgi:hypothetical protein